MGKGAAKAVARNLLSVDGVGLVDGRPPNVRFDILGSLSTYNELVLGGRRIVSPTIV